MKELIKEASNVLDHGFYRRNRVGVVRQIPEIVITNQGYIFFIDQDKYLNNSILLKNGRHYIFYAPSRFISPIEPVGHITQEELQLQLECYFIKLPELGNAIYIYNCLFANKGVLIYFNDQCQDIPKRLSSVFRVGDKIVKIIESQSGIMVIDNEGQTVPCHCLMSTRVLGDCIFENDHMKIIINYHFKGTFIAKSGQKTKAAARLAEIEQEPI